MGAGLYGFGHACGRLSFLAEFFLLGDQTDCVIPGHIIVCLRNPFCGGYVGQHVSERYEQTNKK